MKKYLLSFAVLMSATLFTACNKDNDDHGKVPVIASEGFYVVCSGNMSSGINGSLSYYDNNLKQGYTDAFKTANGKSLGMTANDALRYGDKLYIVVDGEHSVFVTDANTMKLKATIDMTSPTMLGETGGVSPRRITASDGLIYVSTYGGFVAAIDTLNYSLKQKYKTGSYPEGIAVSNGYLYVANSDYGNGNASISKINLATGAREAAIAKSEGEKQSEINIAQGKAQATIAIANATAEAIALIAKATQQQGGDTAVNLKVAEQYINAFEKLAKTNNTLIIPNNLSDVSGMVGSVMKIIQSTNAKN